MAAVIFSVVSSLLQVTQSQSTICLWGYTTRDGIKYTQTINGLYEQTWTFNGAPFYNRTVAKSCDDTYDNVYDWYIWYDNNEWSLSKYHQRYLYCHAASNKSVSCSGEWMGDSSTYDPVSASPLIIQNDTCPEWNCNGIRVSGSDVLSCDGTYTPTPTPYKYEKTNSNRVLWLYENTFIWVCTLNESYPSADEYGCDVSAAGNSPDNIGWKDLKQGEWWTFTPTTSPWHLGNLYCIATPSPTAVTQEPTMTPTNVPSTDPTIDPTLEPTIQPIPNPTAPTMEPTVSDPTSSPVSEEISTNIAFRNGSSCIVITLIVIICYFAM